MAYYQKPLEQVSSRPLSEFFLCVTFQRVLPQQTVEYSVSSLPPKTQNGAQVITQMEQCLLRGLYTISWVVRYILINVLILNGKHNFTMMFD